jgi:iron complex outermembrane receptor protein
MASGAAAQVPQESAPPASPETALITVTAPPLAGRVLAPGVSLAESALIDRQPRTVAEALRGLPGVAVRTNSRGETIVRVRGAEERQTQVFLDGAPLGVPWDGRIDLGLVPAGAITDLSVRKGAVAIEYGTNAVAGVVDLQTRRSGTLFSAQAGTLGLYTLSGAAGLDAGPVNLLIAASHQGQDALRVADPAALPFSQDASRRRTNTDGRATSLLLGAGGQIGALNLRASVLHIDAARGIAPESDRDPAINAPRYWRYPGISLTQAQAVAELDLGDATARFTGWRQWFGQTIDAYRNASYTALRSRQVDDDDTLGGRLTLHHGAGPATLRWAVSAQTTDHRQQDTPFPAAIPGPLLLYRQTTLSAGLEADVPLGSTTDLTLGAGWDRSANPLTGDKPGQPARSAATFTAALRHATESGLTFSLAAGRRNRFPSARELFGEALGRFLANPDLAPEQAWLADAEVSWKSPTLRLAINPWANHTTGSIGQRVVRVGGQNLRQRFNQAPATSFGLDLLLQWKLAPDFSAELTGSVQRARTEDGTPLLQRPAHEVMLAIDWAPADVIDIRGEVRRIGPVQDLDAAGALTRLPGATEINLRARLPIARIAGARLAATAAIDNLADALILPQSGLPAPGRTIRVGLIVTS